MQPSPERVRFPPIFEPSLISSQTRKIQSERRP